MSSMPPDQSPARVGDSALLKWPRNWSVRAWARTGVVVAISALVQNKFHGWSLGTGTWLVLTWVLLGVAVLVLLLTEPWVRQWLPSVAVEGGDGLAIRFRRPVRRGRRGRRKLRQDALALASDMRTHLRESSPSLREAEQDDWRDASREMDAAPSKDEGRQIWHEYTKRSLVRSDLEKQELSELFGARLLHVTGEFQRRGLLKDYEVTRLRWQAGSHYWIMEAANRIEALAHRL